MVSLCRLLLGLWLVLGLAVGARAQSLSPMPPGMVQFMDGNGQPYAGGLVYLYVPGTTSTKQSWKDSSGRTLNSNPIQLDPAGRAIIWGAGTYRQVLVDQYGNTIWDQVTNSVVTQSSINFWGGTSSGTANVQAALPSGFSAQAGNTVEFLAGFTTTGSFTFNGLATYVNGTGGPVAAGANTLVAGNLYSATYNSILNAYVISGAVNSISASNVKFSPPGSSLQVSIAQHIGQDVYVKDYGASGSNAVTTGSIVSGQTTLSLTSPQDFANGQGLTVYGAGPAFTASPVSSIVSTLNGNTGGTTRVYAFSSVDALGGVGAAVKFTVYNVPSLISAVNSVSFTLVQGGGSFGYAVWRSDDGQASWHFQGVGFGPAWKDGGVPWAALPNWIPASPPAVAQADWLVSNVVSGGGTTTLTLANAASTTVSGANVQHDDTAALSVAVTSNSQGANLVLGCGVYNISAPVNIPYGNMGFSGQGSCTQINTFGMSDDFILLNSNVSAQQRFNFLRNMYITEYNKAANSTVRGTNLFTFSMSDVYIDNPAFGITLQNSNTILLKNVYFFSIRGWAAWAFNMYSDSTNYTCCLFAENVYVHGNAQYAGSLLTNLGSTDKVGYRFDGNAATVYANGMAASNIEGDSFQIINDTGNPAPPTYLSFINASGEFPNGRNVNIYGPGGGPAGPSDIYFTDSTFTGATNTLLAGPGNPNINVDSTSARLVFKGGKASNASCRGINTDATNVKIVDMEIGNNSSASVGGTAGSCDGITIGPDSRGLVVSGNTVGDPFNPTVQRYPLVITNGADYFAVTGNVFYGNATNCVSNGSSSATSRIVANNAGSC